MNSAVQTNKRNVIFFLCANTNEIKIHIFERLKEQISKVDNIDLYIAIDEDNEGEIDKLNHDKIIYFSYNDYSQYKLFRKCVDHRAEITYVGNTIYPFIDFCVSHPQYDNYMFYEDDIIYTDNICSLFEESEDCDIITPYEITPITMGWWWGLRSYTLTPPFYSLSMCYNCMLNCYIISKKTAELLNERLLSQEWLAHHEMIVATEIVANNLVHKLFSNANECYIFAFNNDLTEFLNHNNHIVKGTFYHPIKELWQLEQIINNV